MIVINLKSRLENWEGIYVDGELIKEDHHIDRNEWLLLAEKYGYKSSDIQEKYLTYEDDNHSIIVGRLPQFLYSLSGNYYLI